MKLFKMLLALCIQFTCINSFSQECIVVPEALKGTYEGGCEKGKAFGPGKANGADSYAGEFKNGLPEGMGKYTWSNQNYYIGNWKKGLRDGRGVMHFSRKASTDSIMEGYWRRDKYLGFYEKAYEVVSNTSRVNRINCRISDKDGEDIIISVSKIGEGIVSISSISILRGTFYSQNTQRLTNMSITNIKQVTFPFSAIFYLSNGETSEILFNEKSDYDVSIEVI